MGDKLYIWLIYLAMMPVLIGIALACRDQEKASIISWIGSLLALVSFAASAGTRELPPWVGQAYSFFVGVVAAISVFRLTVHARPGAFHAPQVQEGRHRS